MCCNCRKNNSEDRNKVQQKASGKVYKMSEEMKEYLGQVTEKHGFHTRMAVPCRWEMDEAAK